MIIKTKKTQSSQLAKSMQLQQNNFCAKVIFNIFSLFLKLSKTQPYPFKNI